MNNTMGQLLPIRTAQKCFVIAAFILCGCCQILTAQQRLGLANGNYGGVNNLINNPADIANSRYKTYIGLAQTDVHLTNNYLKLNNVLKNATDSVPFLTKDGNYLSAGFDIVGLSWIQSINPKITLGLTTRVRGTAQGIGITRNLYSSFDSLVDVSSKPPTDIAMGNMNINTQMFSEIDASYAHTLIENGAFALKVGATVKRLNGLFSTGMALSDFNAQHTKVVDDEHYKIQSGQLNVAYLDGGDLGAINNVSFSDIFKRSQGSGWGFDVGATYEARSGAFTNADGTTAYQYRVGVSLTDVGSIKYNGDNVRFYSKDLKNTTFKVTNPDSLSDLAYVIKGVGGKVDSAAKSFTAQIPTMLRLNVDVRLTQSLFVNVYWAANLVGQHKLGTQYASFIAVTPRFETRFFDVALPISLANNYKTFGMGLGLRAGPVTLGMDNLTSLFGNISTVNAYAGLNIGFGRKKRLQDIAEEEKIKEKEAEVAEAKMQSGKKGKKAAKEDPLSTTPVKSPSVADEPKPKTKRSIPFLKSKKKAKETSENMPKEAVVAVKPTIAKPKEAPTKAPVEAAAAATPTVVKPKEAPTKASVEVVAAPKPSTPTTAAKPQVAPAKTPEQRPLSTTPAKTLAPVAATPKPSVPTTVDKPKPSANVNVSPIGANNSGRMGECIEFFPNKAAISGSSMTCLKEISKFLSVNKSLKLTINANVLATEKVSDMLLLKTERAKTIRNFLIQSGVEASRLAIKISDKVGDTAIVLTPQ